MTRLPSNMLNLAAQGMRVLRNTPQLGQGVLALQHLMRMTERLPSGAMIPNFERIDYTRMQTLNTQGTFAVSAYTCHDGSARALKFDTSHNKVLRPDDHRPIVNPRTLRREAVMLRWLSDARIMRSYGSICQVFSEKPAGLPMLVMPLMPNGNLRQFLIRNPNGPRIPLVCTLYHFLLDAVAHTTQLRDVASAIQYLYGVGILHCDLKSVSRIYLVGVRG
jgi:serine/threonine protein kinase